MSGGAYWCLRVPIGVCGCLLVSVGAYWCLLVSEGAYTAKIEGLFYPSFNDQISPVTPRPPRNVCTIEV